MERHLQTRSRGDKQAVPGKRGVLTAALPDGARHGRRIHSALALFLWFCLYASAGLASGIESAFEQANRLYEQGRFTEAAAAYERLMKEQGESAALHFNLGNALFKAGQLGRAVWHYRVAERLSPRDPDIQANLQFARDSAGGAAFRPPMWQRWLERLSLNEWAWLFGATLWLWLGVLIARLVRPQHRAAWRGLTVAGTLAVALAAVCLAGAVRARLGLNTAVVVVKEAVARYGPLPESESHFTLRDGNEVRIIDHKEDWLQVADAQGRAGWVRKEQVLALP